MVMNKLKRANQTIVTTTEPTKASAVTSHRSNASKIVATTSTVHPPSNEFDKTPRNAVEQYWAARALTAEALLKARTEHHRDLRAMTYSEDMKREVGLFNLLMTFEAHPAVARSLELGSCE